MDSTVIALRTLFDAELADGFEVILELRLAEQAFRIEVADGELGLAHGEAADAAASIATDPMTLAAVLWQGSRLSAAERSGDLAVRGDRRSAKRFLTLFPLPEPD